MIRFGTSGWRAIIAEEFTVANVRRVAAAIGRHLIATGQARRGVFVGYDTRFMSDRFAHEAAITLAARGVPVVLSPTPIPTPAVAFAVVEGRRAGGINITASHNPPEYSGIKFSVASGAPAPPEITRAIEQLLADEPGTPPGRPAQVREADARAAYFRQLLRLVRPNRIRKARLQI